MKGLHAMVPDQPNRVERRLSAILVADVAGYSRLMHDDEEATHARFTALFAGAIMPAIAEHGGRIVKNTGDGFLAEFASAVEAVRAATQFQTQIHELSASDAEDGRLVFRVGINIGDVIVEPHDIFGDDVNIAARLESIAEPGGICISSSAYDRIRGKLAVDFADLGEQNLKNIARPVRVYRVQFEGATTSASSLAFPDRPSIAVLPFQNLSGDPEQDYFADGMVEEITTALSRIRQLFVITRNSTLIYKGRIVDVKQISRELGVRYVVEGSVRRVNSHVRITAQLVDAVAGHNVWVERYEREFADIFALQDEITERIAASIEPQLYAAEYIRSKRKSPESLDAWECAMRALSYVNTRSMRDYAIALELLKKAIQIDATYALPHALIAYMTALEVLYGWMPEAIAIPAARDAAEKGLLLDADDPWVHLALGYVHQQSRRSEDAVQEYKKALSLNPNFALAHTYLATALCYLGQIDEALAHIVTSERLSPRGLFQGINSLMRSVAYYFAGKHKEAAAFARKSILESPGIVTGYRQLVVNSALAGEIDEARAALRILKGLQPELSLKWIEEWLPYRREGDRQKVIEGFRLAGLE
jgi:adenylate cyclase